MIEYHNIIFFQVQQQVNNPQQFQNINPNFGGGNSGNQQGHLGQLQQPSQQQQAFMMHQQQLHNQRLLDEGIAQGIQGQPGKSLLQEASTNGTPPTTGWGEPPAPSSNAPNNWGSANIGQQSHANISAGSGTPPNMHTGPGVGQAGPPSNLLHDGIGGPNKDGN